MPRQVEICFSYSRGPHHPIPATRACGRCFARLRLCSPELIKHHQECYAPSQCSSCLHLICNRKTASLDIFSHLLRVFWLRRNIVDDSPVLTPMETSIKINILSNEEVVDDLPDVPVDKHLQACLISKSLVHRLGARYEAVPKLSVTDSTGRTHAVIGKVELRWHRRESSRSHLQIFSVVNALSTHVILGASALPKGKESDVHTLGLNKQTEGDTFLICFSLRKKHCHCSGTLWLTSPDSQIKRRSRRRRVRMHRLGAIKKRRNRKQKRNRKKPRRRPRRPRRRKESNQATPTTMSGRALNTI